MPYPLLAYSQLDPMPAFGIVTGETRCNQTKQYQAIAAEIGFQVQPSRRETLVPLL